MKLRSFKVVISSFLLVFSTSFLKAQLFKDGPVISENYLSYGNLSTGDFDEDGLDDLMVSGREMNIPSLRVFNSIGGIFVGKIVPGLPDEALNASWVDYDGDGDLDVFVASESSGAATTIDFYINNKGIFAPLNIKTPRLHNARTSFADYDNDGDLDVLVGGYFVNNNIYKDSTCLLKNHRNKFSPTETNLSVGYSSAIAWADFNGDGHRDVIITNSPERSGNNPILYLGRSDEHFEVVESIPWVGAIEIADFDHDNDPDLLSPHSGILVNNGSAIFSRDEQITFPESGDDEKARWVDFDRDGDLDIFFVASYVTDDGIVHESVVYELSSGDYTVISDTGFPNTDTFAFFDYDHDGDEDVMNFLSIAGIRIHQNTMKSNPYPYHGTPPVPAGFTAYPLTDGAISLSWRKPITEVATFQIEMGITPDDFQLVGTTEYEAYTVSGLSEGVDYFFRVRRSTEAGFSPYSKVIKSQPGATSLVQIAELSNNLMISASAWIDCDNDGDLDLIYMGNHNAEYELHVLKNESGAFIAQPHELPGLAYADIDVADYDLDGDMDLLISGATTSSTITFIADNHGDFNFTVSGQVLTGVRGGFSRWVEINGDGFPDIYLSGTSGIDANSVHRAQVLLNSGHGTFGTIAHTGLPTLYQGEFEAGDFNKDGKIDIAVIGWKVDSSSFYPPQVCEIYRNEGDDTFKLLQTFDGYSDGSVESGDLDSDGDVDLIVAGSEKEANIFWNENGVFSKDAANELMSSKWEDLEVGDIDNDGDTDIIMGGIGKSTVYLNQGNRLFAEGYYPLIPRARTQYNFGDFDADGDLDLFGAGYYSGWDYAYILKNNVNNPNTEPLPPVIQKVVPVAGGFALVTGPGQDDHSASKSLTKNYYVKDADDRYLFNSHADVVTGRLKFPLMGNAFINDSIVIQHLNPGTYTIGVQDIDNSFQASGFATVTATLELTSPDIARNPAICEWTQADIEVFGNGIVWFSDQALSHEIATGNRFRPFVKNSDTTFFVVQTIGEIRSTTREVKVEVHKTIRDSIDRSGGSLVAPAATSYQWFRNDSLLNGETLREIIHMNKVGVYRVALTKGACSVDTISILIRPQGPTAIFKSAVCENDTLEFIADGTSIRWYDVGENEIGEGENFIYVPLTKSDSSIMMSQTIEDIESEKIKLTWTVQAMPEMAINYMDDTLRLEGPNGQRYEWFRNDTLLIDAVSKKIHTPIPGIYRATSMIDLCIVDSLFFTVRPEPPSILSMGAAACLFTRFSISVQGTQVKWYDREDQLVISGTIFGMDINSFSDTSVHVTQTINMAESERKLITWDIYKHPGDSIVIENGILNASEAISYQWYHNDEPLSKQPGRQLEPDQGGAYYVDAFNFNCVTRSETVLITPVDDQLEEIYVAYSQTAESLIIRYPNAPLRCLTIYNIAGQKILKVGDPERAEDDRYHVPINGVREGLYIVVIEGIFPFSARFIKTY